MKFNDYISYYQVTDSQLMAEMSRSTELRSWLLGELSYLEGNFAGLNWWRKIIRYLPYHFSVSQLMSAIREQDESLERFSRRRARALNTLILEVGRDLMEESTSAPELANLEANYESLRRLVISVEEIHCSGLDALSSIDNALSDISASEMTEIMDLASDSAGISILSASINCSTSDAVGFAATAVQRFRRKLECHQQVLPDIQHGMTTEMIDLSFDLMFGGALDIIGSLFSLQALAESESQLNSVRSLVKDALDSIEMKLHPLRSQLNDLHTEIEECKTRWRAQVRPILEQCGIKVPEGHGFVLDDIYAPSAASDD